MNIKRDGDCQTVQNSAKTSSAKPLESSSTPMEIMQLRASAQMVRKTERAKKRKVPKSKKQPGKKVKKVKNKKNSNKAAVVERLLSTVSSQP